jgi:hypothetical protein
MKVSIKGSPPKGAKKVGRPPKISPVKYKRAQVAQSAKNKGKSRKRRSDRIKIVEKKENPDSWKELLPPPREGHILSQDQINTAIRTISELKSRGVADVMNIASKCLDISVDSLYKYWNEFISQKEVPTSFLGKGSVVRMKFVGLEWFEAIRAEVERIRLVEKRAVEIPDIQKWLLDKHHITISRTKLRHRLIKFGFKFSKLHKLVLKKESPRIRKLRMDYLKKRFEYNKLIAENKRRRQIYIDSGRPIPEYLKEVVYIYLDESYVNR